MAQPIPYGASRKLPDLFLKCLLLWTDLDESLRAKMKPLLHVPLDAFSLRAVRLLVRDPEIPETARMGFVCGRSMYDQIQSRIRQIVRPAGMTPTDFDWMAWNFRNG